MEILIFWKFDFQDFWTGTVLECQATSGSGFVNMCSKMCMCEQSCHFTFIKSEIKDSITNPRSSKNRLKKNTSLKKCTSKKLAKVKIF